MSSSGAACRCGASCVNTAALAGVAVGMDPHQCWRMCVTLWPAVRAVSKRLQAAESLVRQFSGRGGVLGGLCMR